MYSLFLVGQGLQEGLQLKVDVPYYFGSRLLLISHPHFLVSVTMLHYPRKYFFSNRNCGIFFLSFDKWHVGKPLS